MKIDIAVLNQGWIRTELVERLVKLSHDNRHELRISYPTQSPVANNRNTICKAFREGDGDFLLMTDDDQFWQKNPLDAIDLDLDVIGFPTHVFQPAHEPVNPIRWNVVKLPDTPDGAVREVRAIGSGSLLIARRVLVHPMLRAPFLDHFDEDGIRQASEDLWFCDKARKAGFKIWMATNNPCHHVKAVNLLYLDLVMKGEVSEHLVGNTGH